MGMGGAHMMHRARMTDDLGEDWAGALAQMDSAERAMRGGEATAANQAYQQLRSTGMGSLAQVKSSALQAAAQRASARMAASASRYGSGLSAALGGLMIPSQLGGAGSDMMQQWATKNQQGPKVNKGKAMLGGAMGGAMQGMGMGGMMGGGKGGGPKPMPGWEDIGGGWEMGPGGFIPPAPGG